MDRDAKIGQLLMAGFRGLVAAPGDPVLRDLEQHRLGSVVLFDYDVPLQSPVRNIESAAQVRAVIGVRLPNRNQPRSTIVTRLPRTLAMPISHSCDHC